MTILVVDDEPAFRLLVSSILLQEWCLVVTAENGQDALEKIQGRQFDLVISDVYMPVMNGIKLHRAVRALPQFARLQFLFVSGYDDQHTLSAVQDPSIEGFLKKGRPVSLLKQWVEYLTSSGEKRPKIPPRQ